jgi:hypothetical protein
MQPLALTLDSMVAELQAAAWYNKNAAWAACFAEVADCARQQQRAGGLRHKAESNKRKRQLGAASGDDEREGGILPSLFCTPAVGAGLVGPMLPVQFRSAIRYLSRRLSCLYFRSGESR